MDKDQKTPIEPMLIRPDKAERTTYGRVNVPFLNVRSKPIDTAIVLSVINKGSIVEIFDDVDGFYKIATPQVKVGYVMKRYINVEAKTIFI